MPVSSEETVPTILVVSDSIGETAEGVARAAASQFNGTEIPTHRISYVDDPNAIRQVVQRASELPKALIVHTLILPELRALLKQEAIREGVPTVDIMGPTMEALRQLTETEPRLEAGLIHRLDQAYFRRIEAIEFAVRYDDGKEPSGLPRADLVLLGVSRTSKTPVSMYLAHRGYKVANVPLIPEVDPPSEIWELEPAKVVGLTIQPRILQQIRRERLRSIGLEPDASYGNMERIKEELEYARRVFRDLKCKVVEVTNTAVEETANRVLDIFEKEVEISE